MCIIGVFVLSCGCISPETSSTTTAGNTESSSSNVKILANGDEKISVEITGPAYWAESSVNGIEYIDFVIPLRVKNVGKVGVDQTGFSGLTFTLIDYAGFQLRDTMYLGKMYPGESYVSNATFFHRLYTSDKKYAEIMAGCARGSKGYDCERVGAYRREQYDEIRKMGAQDLTLKCSFGNDTATWTIPKSTFMTFPAPKG